MPLLYGTQDRNSRLPADSIRQMMGTGSLGALQNGQGMTTVNFQSLRSDPIKGLSPMAIRTPGYGGTPWVTPGTGLQMAGHLGPSPYGGKLQELFNEVLRTRFNYA